MARTDPNHILSVYPTLSLYPKEAAIIGRLVVGYGALEVDLMWVLGATLEDKNIATRVLFRNRGEEQRIAVADALIRPKFAALGYDDRWAATIDAMRHCKIIRNQYAHSIWFSTRFEDGKVQPEPIRFVALESAVQSSTPVEVQTWKAITVELLSKQEAFFINTRQWLCHLQHVYEDRAALDASLLKQQPPRIEKPPPYIDLRSQGHQPIGLTRPPPPQEPEAAD